jgi:hypothetical protein
VDVGNGLQIWEVAVNILIMYSQAIDKGWPSSLGGGIVLIPPHHKETSMLQNVTQVPSYLDSFKLSQQWKIEI